MYRKTPLKSSKKINMQKKPKELTIREVAKMGGMATKKTHPSDYYKTIRAKRKSWPKPKIK